MFEILCRFLEDEPVDMISWDADTHQAHAMEEMQFLYRWWKKRQNRENEDPLSQKDVESPDMNFIPTKEEWTNEVTGKKEKLLGLDFVHKSPETEKRYKQAVKDSFVWEENCEKEDEEMMKRLIAIRKFMWT
ncbi:hypothetical protein ACFLQL_03085 [Verrucomicrobiota bacterium]